MRSPALVKKAQGRATLSQIPKILREYTSARKPHPPECDLKTRDARRPASSRVLPPQLLQRLLDALERLGQTSGASFPIPEAGLELLMDRLDSFRLLSDISGRSRRLEALLDCSPK